MSLAQLILPADWKILLGGAAVIVGLAFFTLLIALTCRRSARSSAVPAKAEQLARCPRRDWDIVTGIALAGLSQMDAALALHARASERIDAAEYAFGRLLAECATVMQAPPAARRQPVAVLARGAAHFEHQKLAA
jgi:hypothetical protein